MNKPSEFNIIIASPIETVYEGKIKALTLINELGPFDVIARHTNFISAIEKTITIYELNGDKKSIPIESGIVKITLNSVEIFLGIEPVPEKSP